MPQRGIFIENRVRSQVASGRADVRVICPTPWFPFKGKLFRSYAAFARVPRSDIRHGIAIDYPRFLAIPRLGMFLNPFVVAASARSAIDRLIKGGFDFDVLDAYYLYPDGVAAAHLAGRLRKPFVMTALGTDVNLIPHHWLPRSMIRWAAIRAAGLTTVCQSLKDGLVGLGVPQQRVKVILHGVDLELFRPAADREALRRRLKLMRHTLLSVGNLVRLKGHDLTIKALAKLPDTDLLIAGEGEEGTSLRRLAERLGVSDRVRFLGHVSQRELPEHYCAADALILASSREGIANVIMESLACGTPVLATAVGGAPEVITTPEAGRLIADRDASSIASAVRDLFAAYPDRLATRRYAERFSWDTTTVDHLALVDGILSCQASSARNR